VLPGTLELSARHLRLVTGRASRVGRDDHPAGIVDAGDHQEVVRLIVLDALGPGGQISPASTIAITPYPSSGAAAGSGWGTSSGSGSAGGRSDKSGSGGGEWQIRGGCRWSRRDVFRREAGGVDGLVLGEHRGGFVDESRVQYGFVQFGAWAPGDALWSSRSEMVSSIESISL
jgi:hypothetical protein